MIHNLFYSSGDIVSFDDTDINSRVSNQFQTEYVELLDGRRKTVGYLNGIAFFQGDAGAEVNWHQVRDSLALINTKQINTNNQ